MRSIRLLICGLALLVSMLAPVEAGPRSAARASARAQARGGMGHHVAVPAGYYEGVSVASSRSVARSSTCFSSDSSKVRVASVVKCSGGQCFASNIYKPR